VQLFGHYVGAAWQTGLLTASVQKASRHAELLAKYRSAGNKVADSSTVKWIVLDGELNPTWIDGVNSLLAEPYLYRSLNSDITRLHGQLSLLILCHRIMESKCLPCVCTRYKLLLHESFHQFICFDTY